jgi:MFS family permease
MTQTPYRAVFARPGARSLAFSCALGWLSFASYGLALVLAVERATGSFAVAGGAVAAFSAGSALLAPVRGRIVDRRGARALPYFAVVHAAGLGLVVAGCLASHSDVLLIGASGLAGLSTPPLIATARSVWPQITGPELAGTGHAVNAALGDVGAVVGPAFVGAVAALASPVVALALLIPGVLAGTVLLAVTAPPNKIAAPRRKAHRVWGVLSESAGLRVIVASELLIGLSFGALDVAAPVVAAEAGAAELAALPLAAFAASSVAATLWSGTGRLQRPPVWRYLAGCLILAALLLLCLVATSLVGVTLVLVGAGAGYGLLNVALFELLEDVVAADRAVEAFTWLTTWAGVGMAAGAAIAGQLSRGGAAQTLLLVAIPAALAAGMAVTRRSALRPLVA